MTTVPSRGTRLRRSGHRPGWGLLTALLSLAIAASSALVFTSRVELLKLAVILALWAAVAAAFVSVVYRRQSDTDQARARDLKLVYDLQLDREISARREYELTVESQLRRELAAELRGQAADEVAALRAELAALRANLEILFDADLGHRPALETERTAVRAYSDWARGDSGSGFPAEPPHAAMAMRPGGLGDSDDSVIRTAENPIIDVSEVGVPAAEIPPGPAGRVGPTVAARPAEAYRGSHRHGSQQHREPDVEPPARHSRRQPEPASTPGAPVHAGEPVRPAHTAGWQPVVAEGKWLPPGSPGSNWASDAVDSAMNSHPDRQDHQDHQDRQDRQDRQGHPGHPSDRPAAFSKPASGPRHGRNSGSPEPVTGARDDWHYGGDRRAHARHSAEPSSPAGYGIETASIIGSAPAAPPSTARHRGAEPPETNRPNRRAGGQSVADLLARLQTDPSGGRRRRRHEE